jgi:hypothetical protein
MLRSTRVRLAAVATAATLSLGVAAGPAAAAPQQGLVNVNVVDNTVQVPIGIAANVCGVQAGVLAQGLVQGPVDCTALGDATATAPGGGAGGGGGPQNGLVNIDISNNTIQVPVGIAANICGVQAGVLAVGLVQAPVTCDATGNGTAGA